MKPLLAKDYEPGKIVFPVGVQPKIDGVRGLTTEGKLTGRSLKKHKNIYTTEFYSGPEYAMLDGELAAAAVSDPELCRKTSSALSTILGQPFTLFHAFDYLDKRVINAAYEDRYEYLKAHIHSQQLRGLCRHAQLVPMFVCNDLEEVLAYEDKWLEMGYEGLIIRNLKAKHKEGRSTVNKGELLRIKRFISAEALVTGIEEGADNNNEPQTNELGRTFRTSHIGNKTLSGMVGNFQCTLLDDVEHDGVIILKKEQPITVSPGTLTLAQRKGLFDNPEQVLNHIITFKFFPKGIKDKPRFPTYQSHRSAEDISN
jgi:DNA ligase-1